MTIINDPFLEQSGGKGSESEAVPAGMSRREYRQKMSEQVHSQPEGSVVSRPVEPTHVEEAAVPIQNVEPEPTPESAPPARFRLPAFPILKLGPPFWTITGIFSLVTNVVLVVVVISLAKEIFSLKSPLQEQLIGGLYNNFVLMDQARIQATIPVTASVPAKFNLPVNTDTTVVLKKDTIIRGATILELSTGGLSIYNAPADIVLPAGLELPISLSIVVPVDQQIPVNLNVEVDIPLNKTDLHAPFVGLQKVVSPYYQMLKGIPGTLQEAVCGKQATDTCKALIP
jgi:hypothetical protein